MIDRYLQLLYYQKYLNFCQKYLLVIFCQKNLPQFYKIKHFPSCKIYLIIVKLTESSLKNIQ
jgi:hypothetical protein